MGFAPVTKPNEKKKEELKERERETKKNEIKETPRRNLEGKEKKKKDVIQDSLETNPCEINQREPKKKKKKKKIGGFSGFVCGRGEETREDGGVRQRRRGS
jgi:hypothetical protein